MKTWLCGNCGHEHVASDSLTELGFTQYDKDTTKIACAGCGTYTIQRVHTYDDAGYPVAGHFLIVKSHIRKGQVKCQSKTSSMTSGQKTYQQ